jgi:hypothetical protein
MAFATALTDLFVGAQYTVAVSIYRPFASERRKVGFWRAMMHTTALYSRLRITNADHLCSESYVHLLRLV